MSIDIVALVTSVCPIEDIAKALAGESLKALSGMAEEIPNQISSIEEQEEEAEKEPNEKIKEAAKKRLEEQKKKLEEMKKQLQDQINKMIEDMKKKVQEWLDSANIYAQEIADASEAIPGACQRYINAGIALVKAETVTLVQISSEIATAAASMPPVILSSLITSAMDDISSAKEEYEAAKSEIKTAVTRLNTAVFNVEDILAPIAAIPILGEAIMSVVMAPIKVVEEMVNAALSLAGLA